MSKICTLKYVLWTLWMTALLCAMLPANATDGPESSRQFTGVQRIFGNPGPECLIRALQPDHPLADTVSSLYASNGFRPLWLDPRRYESLILAIDGLIEDGLDPLDYGVDQLRERRDTPSRDQQAQRCRDLTASYGYLLALYHLSHGRFDPETLEPLWRAPTGTEPLAEVPALAGLETLAGEGLGDIEMAFHRARPGFLRYHQLRHAYGRWRDQYRFANWPEVPSGPSLKSDMDDDRVSLVRQRLEAEGFLSPLDGAPEEPRHYDERLAGAVRAFQQRHRLKVDGVVGPQTRAEMNLPRAFRYDQVRVNLERLRWLWRDMEYNTVLVDIAGAEVTYLRDNTPLWRSRVQVGTSARPTPVLKSRITHITFNPTWTVPPTIYRKDKLPAIRRDIGYLAKNRIKVLDANGRQLDPYTINWNNPGAIMLRQDAGPTSALGLVAIRFPNPFAVYLHDTPSQNLFSNQQRATSSGCVRVEGAMDLASLLFEGASDERLLAIEAIKVSGHTRNVNLPTPVPIVLAYWTADVDEQGELEFRPDIYGRDESLVKAFRAAEN